MAYIYKIINDINDKVYVGMTNFSIEKRWAEHCRDSKKNSKENRPLYRAMNKYGIDHFQIQLIEETDSPQEREKYWIEYFDSFKKGYNATIGGDGSCYVDIELIYSLWNNGKNITEIHKITGYANDTIRKHLENKGISIEERMSRRVAWERKKIGMLDKDNEAIIEIFPSSLAAENFLKKRGARRHIMEVCKGKRKSAYGYKWKLM